MGAVDLKIESKYKMEPIHKRPRIAELVASVFVRDVDFVLDRALAFQILTQVEVRDAMNWAIASGGDPRFQKILALMREEDIWKFWMMRDLRVVYDVLIDQELPPWIQFNPNEMDRPLWKLCYLWYRIIVGAFQSAFISYVKSYETIDIRYVHLNVIEHRNTDDNSIVYWDFRNMYNDFRGRISGSRYRHREYRAYSISAVTTKKRLKKFIQRFIDTPDVMLTPNEYTALIQLAAELRRLSHTNVSRTMQGEFDVYWRIHSGMLKTLARFPRLYQRTKIIVADPMPAPLGAGIGTPMELCVVCQQRESQGECAQCGAPLCGAECARHDWEAHDPDAIEGHVSQHRALCKLLATLSIVGNGFGKRGRQDYDSELPTTWRRHEKRAGHTPDRLVDYDPYARVLNPTIARNEGWIKRFAQLDAGTIREALQGSPTFRYYFANNPRFWYYVRAYHPDFQTNQ